MNKNSPRLSVIYSFRNEEDVLPELIRRTREVLTEEQRQGHLSSFEIIFVNDASTDHSLEILLEKAAECKEIRIINMSRCFGPSPSVCVLAGMEYSSGDVVVYLDADLQDPPEMIGELLNKWRNDPSIDVVHTVRKTRAGESRIKLAFTRLGYWILNKVTSVKIPIEAGDFKLLSRRAVNHITQFREKRPFLRGLVCWIGFKQEFIPYHRDARFAGRSKFSIFGKDVISNFFDSALISFSSAPLKIAAYLGLLAIIVDFGILIHVLLEKFQGRAIPGWTAIMMTIIFFAGVQLICLGFIGLYLNSVFEEGKHRPNYIIDSVYGFPHLKHNPQIRRLDKEVFT